MKLIIANLTMKQKNLEIIMKKPFQLMLEGPNSSVWGSLVEYIYDYFSTNIIYWEALLVRREKVMRNGTKGPSYDFLTMALER